MSHVLIVDDEESICWGLRHLLLDEGCDVAVAASAEEALEAVQQRRPDLVVLDVRLPGLDGISAMASIKELAGPVPFVVITAFGNLDTAVMALRNGAIDYLPKPFDLNQAATVIRRALSPKVGLKQANQASQSLPAEELYGSSSAMQEVFKRIALVAPTDSPVLITGESGTGKELVARAIHRYSNRSAAPLVPVNLASLSPTLIESELFGHVKGAFTGADASRRGVLELAHGGTVLFDETADIPLAVQVKLLRVLEQQEVIPVGDVHSRPVVFRVMAATSRDLRLECAEGRFRHDLYFRLSVFEIRLPPLRERAHDIPVLAESFLKRAAYQCSSHSYFLPETIEELCRRRWPGNVRELRNAVEHAALMARGKAIATEHLPPGELPAEEDRALSLQETVRRWAKDQLATPGQPAELYRKLINDVEPVLFEAVLESTGQNRAAAADMLGINRATLRKKLS